MNLIAFAQCCVPDVAAARHLYDVDGLDDAAVAKILFHRCKQQTGGETLRADQQRIAQVALVHGEPEQPQLISLSASEHDEAAILQRLGDTLGGTGRLSGWSLAPDLAILRLRAMQTGVA
jgi:predicted PolB exonuclease-like 3'-5' exonuclease